MANAALSRRYLNMPLSESRLLRVQRLVRDKWESEDELGRFFETVTDAEELHLYADGFNWGTGVEGLRCVIRHQLCDRGTALLIYWRGRPGFFARFAAGTETFNPDQADHFDLLLEIEQKVIAGQFQSGRFNYDPRNDKGKDMTARHNTVPRKRTIPQQMFA